MLLQDGMRQTHLNLNRDLGLNLGSDLLHHLDVVETHPILGSRSKAHSTYFVKLKSGEDAVLKIHPTVSRETDWYRLHAEVAPAIRREALEMNAVVLERISPGTTARDLVNQEQDDQATNAIAGLIATIHSNSGLGGDFTHVKDLAKEVEILTPHLDSRLLRAATKIIREAKTEAVLHGDLHHENVLWNGQRWIAIDPHGYIGPRAFEVGPMLRNPGESSSNGLPIAQSLTRRLAILNKILPFPEAEILDWAFAYSIISCAWTMADEGHLDRDTLSVARLAYELRQTP